MIGINIDPTILAILMLVSLFIVIFIGYPLGIGIGMLALLFGFLIWGPRVGEMLYARTFGLLTSISLLAVPMFIFMGKMLEKTGITEDLYDTLYLWFGGLRGGLAVSTILIGTVLAACLGIISASVAMLSVVALPSMIKRGYDKALACGAVSAGGVLGILIPPSIMLIIYGPMADISVGQLFFGALMPGSLLSALYCTYIIVRCHFQPNLAPVVPVEERTVPLNVKIKKLFISLVPVTFLIASVLGAIFFGIAAPSEAGAIGAFASILIAAAFRKLTWENFKEASLDTLKLCGFMMLIAIMCYCFVGVFIGGKCDEAVRDIIIGVPGGRWGFFAITMLITFLLGFIIDWLAIVFLVVPIVSPLAVEMGFDPVWFGIMVCVNLQMAFLSPPYAQAIFVVKGVAPKELGLTINDIIRGMWPFVTLVAVGLFLCVLFPEIVLWLPRLMVTTG